jgi:hypothetical protein
MTHKRKGIRMEGTTGVLKDDFFGWLIQQVEFFAWLETDRFSGRDADFGAGAGVAANTRLAGLDGEDAETAQLDTVAAAQGSLHGLEDDVYRGFSLSARETRTLDYPLNQILLDHGAYLSLLAG